MNRMSRVLSLRSQFRKRLDAYQQRPLAQQAELGNGAGVVAVPDRPGYVYARDLQQGTVMQVYNSRVAAVDGLPVWVGYDHLNPTLLQVLGIVLAGVGQGPDEPGYAGLPGHGETHRWMGEDGGQDVVWVELRQWAPLRPSVIAPFGVQVAGGATWLGGRLMWVDEQSVELAGYVPASGARWVTVYLDEYGAVRALAGDVGPISAMAMDGVPLPDVGAMLLGAVYLYAGQTEIEESREEGDLVDLRWPGRDMGYQLTRGLAWVEGELDFDVTALAVTLGGAVDAKIAAHAALQSGVHGLNITGTLTVGASTGITGGGTIALGGYTLTAPATGTVALGAGSLGVASINNVSVASHTHAIGSSSNPGIVASLLATDAAGLLQLAAFLVGGASDRVQHTVKGYSSQTYNLVEYTSSIGTVLGAIDAAARFRAPAGSVSAVGIGFYGDTNTGLYQDAADTIGISVGGDRMLQVSADTLSSGRLNASGVPQPLTKKAQDGWSANTIGAEVTHKGSAGSGSQPGGDIVFQTGRSTGSATGTPRVVGSSKSTPVAGTSLTYTWSHTVPYGNQRLLLVAVVVRNNTSQVVNSVTFDGVALTYLASHTQATSTHVEIWYLKAPAVGTGTIVVTLSAAAIAGCMASSWVDVDQSTTFGTPAGAGTSTTNATVNVASATGEVVFAVVGKQDSTEYPISAGSGTVQISQDVSINGTATVNRVYATGYEPGAASVTINWSWMTTSRQWAILGVSLKPGDNSSLNGLEDNLRIRSDRSIEVYAVRETIRTAAASGAVNVYDNVVLVDCSAGDVTLTLPAVALSTGLVLRIKKIDSSAYKVIIDGNGSETIDGDTTQTIQYQWTAVELRCNGSAWYIF